MTAWKERVVKGRGECSVRGLTKIVRYRYKLSHTNLFVCGAPAKNNLIIEKIPLHHLTTNKGFSQWFNEFIERISGWIGDELMGKGNLGTNHWRSWGGVSKCIEYRSIVSEQTLFYVTWGFSIITRAQAKLQKKIRFTQPSSVPETPVPIKFWLQFLMAFLSTLI